jgi:protein FAM32A
MADPYTSISSGKLKLKGVKDGKVSKKKKSSSSKSKPPHGTPSATSTDSYSHQPDTKSLSTSQADANAKTIHSSSATNALTASLEAEDSQIGKLDAEQGRIDGGEDDGGITKTEAERRWDEQRRRRLEERLRREGVKSHKERVQELNRYLSGLSEHHDMPKIGPG